MKINLLRKLNCFLVEYMWNVYHKNYWNDISYGLMRDYCLFIFLREIAWYCMNLPIKRLAWAIKMREIHNKYDKHEIFFCCMLSTKWKLSIEALTSKVVDKGTASPTLQSTTWIVMFYVDEKGVQGGLMRGHCRHINQLWGENFYKVGKRIRDAFGYTVEEGVRVPTWLFFFCGRYAYVTFVSVGSWKCPHSYLQHGKLQHMLHAHIYTSAPGVWRV